MQAEDLPGEVLDFLEGVVLKARQRPLNEGEKYVLRGIWAGHTYDEMVDRSSGKYSKGYLMQSAGPKLLKLLSRELDLDLNKGNLRATLEHKVNFSIPSVNLSNPLAISYEIEQVQSMPGKPTNYFDETLDVSKDVFFGRDQELRELNTSLLNPQLRLSILKGFAGIGKSSLAYLAASQQVDGEEFDAVIFKSLRQRRTTVEFIQEILRDGFSLQDFRVPAEGLDSEEIEQASINELIRYLSDFRCLLIIDNFDTVFSREGILDFGQSSEGYQTLVEQLAIAGHKSHVLITCRAFPQAMLETRLAGRPVRQINLAGLAPNNVQEILDNQKLRDITSDNVQLLTSRLGGVPLGVKLAVAEIQNRYSGNLTHYLDTAGVPENLDKLIRTLIADLVPVERNLLYRIASYGRAVAYSELLDDIDDDLLDNLKSYIDSLRGRSLLALDKRKRYDVHPLIAEISRETTLNKCAEDIQNLSFDNLDAVILVKSSADEFDRQAQVDSVLLPFQQKLKERYSDTQELAEQLQRCLQAIRQSPSQWRGYAAGNIFNLLCSLEINLEGWDFSGLVLQQADFRNVSLRRTRFVGTELIDCVLPEALGCPDTVVFSPTEDKIAVGDADGRVRLWRFDGANWQFDRAFAREHSGWIWSLAFSPDGELLASGGDDETIRLWRVNGKKNRSFFPPLEHSGSIKSVAFSSDFYCGVRGNDRGLIMGTNDEGQIKVWDASLAFDVVDSGFENISAIRVVTVPSTTQKTVFVTADTTGKVQLWSWANRKLELTWESQLHNGAIYGLAVSPDGQFLATGGEDGSVGFWWVETGEPAVVTDNSEASRHDDTVWSIAFSRDGKLFASAGFDQTILLWDVKEFSVIQTLKAHQGKVLGVAFNQTSRLSEHLLVSASDDKTVKSFRVMPNQDKLENWNTQSNHILKGLTSWIWQLTFSPSGDVLAAACDDGQTLLLACHEMAQGEFEFEQIGLLKTDKTRTWTVALNSEGDLLATGGSDNQVKLWDLTTKRQIDQLIGHTDAVRSLAYSSDGQILASASADSNVILWDLQDVEDYLADCRSNRGVSNQKLDGIVESIATLNEHPAQVWAVTFSHNDRILATAGESGEVILYHFDQGTEDIFRMFVPIRRKSELKTNILRGHTDTIWALAFSPDDTLLASSSSDCTIRLWDMATCKCAGTLEGHTDQVHSISISSDGKYLVSSGNDNTIRIWNVRNHELVKTVEKAHQHWIWAISCHPRIPSIFASGSLDERISLRKIDSDKISSFLNQPFAESSIREMVLPQEEKARFLALGASEDLIHGERSPP
jgi:WD40 repeat protein